MKSITTRCFLAVKERIKLLNERGAALVISLMVMLVLMLLSLSLVLQSNTEFLISQNEEDSLKALADGEGVLEIGNKKIRNYMILNRPDDLDEVLNGALNTGAFTNLLGYRDTFISTAGANRDDLNDGNEESTSVVWDDPNSDFNWEVFRFGPDADGDLNFDGNVRTVVYARFVDNFDQAQNLDDTDFRGRLEVKTEYPVWVDDDGDEIQVSFLKPGPKRPAAFREIIGRFAPAGTTAIRTDGDLEVWDDLTICGECGSAHANGSMTFGSSGNPTACGNVTATDTFSQPGGTIVGDRGVASEIYIPIVNPYNPDYVPSPTIFDRSGDPSLPAWLKCTGPTQADPGNSKYFAIVKIANNRSQIYKAYRNWGDSPQNTKWIWRLVAEDTGGSDSFDELQLDDCGRVVACDADIGTCEPDPGAGTAVTPANNTFYGIAPDTNYSTDTCAGDTIQNGYYVDTLDGPQNDWHRNDFPQVSAGYTTANPTAALVSTVAHSTACSGMGASGCSYTMPPLPYLSDDDPAEIPGPVGDDPHAADFDTSFYINNGDFTMSGGTIYSPLYNAVLFIRGNFNYNGNANTLQYSGGSIPINDDLSFDLNNVWRVSLIVTGQIDPGGTVNFAPPNPLDTSYQYLMVAGRDIKLFGSANDLACNSTDCDGAPTGTTPGFAGVILMHEQMRVQGSVGHNGILIAEDRVNCDQSNPVPDEHNVVFGSLQIHYDCLNPIDYWASQNVRLREWEEVQRE